MPSTTQSVPETIWWDREQSKENQAERNLAAFVPFNSEFETCIPVIQLKLGFQSVNLFISGKSTVRGLFGLSS
jgi:hypothetical protein